MSREQIPHDIDAEEALLGACLLAPSAVDDALDVVTAADFYNPNHQRMFEVIRNLHLAGERVDPVTVGAGYAPGDPDAVAQLHALSNMTPAISAARRYATIVLRHAKSRALITMGAEMVDAGYKRTEAADVAARFAAILGDHELIRRHEGGPIRGYYPDIAMLDTGADRDEAQPWIARGVLRRGQRLLIVAKAGIGKSTLLRQLAFCATNGVHPWTGQPSERRRRALVVELEAGEWDIVDSMRPIVLALKRARDLPSIVDLDRPALLHRQGGIDIRTPRGLATLEAAIQQSQPELVVMGPVKYLSEMKPGENYEAFALSLHSLLNELISRYGFALGMEAHFSRGDHGAPGGSERWVDWPDVGYGVHPPESGQIGGNGVEMTVKPFRNPRDGQIWLPDRLVRNAERRLPWSVDDRPDMVRPSRSMFAERWGGTRQVDYIAHDQGEM